MGRLLVSLASTIVGRHQVDLASTIVGRHQVDLASTVVGRLLVNLASIKGIHPSTVKDNPKATVGIAREATRITTDLEVPEDTN